MNAFKKKSEVPETITELNRKMSLLLGNCAGDTVKTAKNSKISKDSILACAMFWDSKQRIDKIKGLILKQQELQVFEDAEDFKVEDLESIELLSLSRNHIMHLQPISCLTTLICLNVNYNKIYDISPLQKLINLQELYASNNSIKTIEPINTLAKLRILNLYSNNIQRLQETLQTLKKLESLQQLDIENNPVFQKQSQSKFVSLSNLSRFNGQLVMNEQKQESGMSASCVVIPSAKFRDTHTSFWNSRSNEKQKNTQNTSTIMDKTCSEWSVSNKNMSYNLVKQSLRQKVRDLQLEYLEIDDKFESEIVKNVQLKSSLHTTLLQQKERQRRRQQTKQKMQELKCLKRKVKSLKQNMFNPQVSKMPKAKCQLLRQIFELQTIKDNKNTQQSKQTEFSELKKMPKADLWRRKFDYDEQIIIGVPFQPKTDKTDDKNDDKYFLDEDDEIEKLLQSNTSAIEDLKKQLQMLNNR